MRGHLSGLLEHALGEPVDIVDTAPLSGGDISDAARVKTDRRQLFVKWQHRGPADLFEREAEALELMRASGTSLRIPEVYAATGDDDGFPAALVLEYIERGSPAPDYDEQLGIGLAQLHAASADAYGFAHDNYCGLTPQPNDWTDDWITFYREKRLRHQVQLIEERRRLSSSQRRLFETLLENLDDILDDSEPPSLIHGDLWSGNVFADTHGRPVLIDPAAYYAHPEAEIGMMELFGNFSDTVYRAYQRHRRLSPGWRDRIPAYSLYHLLNHYLLFGGHYIQRAVETAQRLWKC